MSSSVQVVVRLRPLNEKESAQGTLPVISASTSDRTVTVIKGQGSRQARSSFSFDNVFTAWSTQEEVFDATLRPVISDVLLGFESTVFAYGQTGTGKTHTMEGDLSNPDLHGVIPRSAETIFEALKHPDYQSCSVTCSYLEIYNEFLRDLFADQSAKKNSPKLEILEGKTGPFCRGLSEKQVQTAGDVLYLMEKAQHHRKVGETNMNKSSSRSHCIFTMRIDTIRRQSDGSILQSTGKLHMVDLAGSECAKTANFEKGGSEVAAKDQADRERERQKINQSLLTLGRVVSMLKQQSTNRTKSSHIRIPYRDSKLTRILQESLGGRCKTCIIATVSPSESAVEESISTLKYAQAANGIKNKPVSSTLMSNSVSSSSVAVDRANLDGAMVGKVEQWQDLECRLEYMQDQVAEAQAALARKHLHQQELVENAKKAEEARQRTEHLYEEALSANCGLKGDIEKLVEKVTVKDEQLKKAQEIIHRTTLMLEATQATEKKLTDEASSLLDSLKKSVLDGDEMYKMIIANRNNEVAIKKATETFNIAILHILSDTADALSRISTSEENRYTLLVGEVSSAYNEQISFVSHSTNLIQDLSSKVSVAVSLLKELISDERGIVPTQKAAAFQARELLSNAGTALSEGEREIAQSVLSCREQLAEHTSYLKAKEIAHHQSSENLLVKLANAFSETKEGLNSTLSSASKSLENTMIENSEGREVLASELKNWEASCHEFSTEIANSSEGQTDSLRLSILSSDLKCHESVQHALSEQRSYMQEQERRRLRNFEHQKSALVAQRNEVERSRKRRVDMNEEFKRKLSALVKNHICVLNDEEEDNFAQFVAVNEGLSQMNQSSSEELQQTISTVITTNSQLQEGAQEIRKNVVLATETMRASTSTFDRLSSLAKVHEREARNNASHTEKILGKLAKTENDLSDIQGTLRTDGAKIVDHLEASVAREAPASAKQLSTSGSDAITFASTCIIPKMNATLSNVEKESENLVSALRTQVADMQSRVDATEKELHTIASEQMRTVDSLREQVQTCHNKYSQDVVHNHSIAIEAQQHDLVKSAEMHKDAALSNIAIVDQNTRAARGAMRDYTDNVIRVDAEIELPPSRNVPRYSETLSSTPCESIVLQAMSITSPEAEEQSKEETSEVSAANAKEFDDGASVATSTSVLQDRQLNRAQSEKEMTNAPRHKHSKRPLARKSRPDSKLKRKKARR